MTAISLEARRTPGGPTGPERDCWFPRTREKQAAPERRSPSYPDPPQFFPSERPFPAAALSFWAKDCVRHDRRSDSRA